MPSRVKEEFRLQLQDYPVAPSGVLKNLRLCCFPHEVYPAKSNYFFRAMIARLGRSIGNNSIQIGANNLYITPCGKIMPDDIEGFNCLTQCTDYDRLKGN
jgi:hypothetical protein